MLTKMCLFTNIKYKYLKLVYLILLFVFINFSNMLNAVKYNSYNKVRMQIINKVTGKSEVFDIKTNTIFHFDNKLSLVVKVCYKTTQKYVPEDVMFVQVAKSGLKANIIRGIENNVEVLNNANSYLEQMHSSENNSKKDINDEFIDLTSSKLIFSGWIFSNIPEISGLTDPEYDINIIKCLD